MGWLDARKKETEKAVSKLKMNLEGKKIVSVTPRISWDGTEMENVLIKFDDGSEIEMNGSTQSGCAECNPDGSNVDYISYHYSGIAKGRN